MRVNISFSVDLEEVPKRVIRLLGEASDELEETQEFFEETTAKLGSDNYVASIEEITKIRDILASVDARLDDCMQILSGYSKTLTDLAAKEHQQQPASNTSEFSPEQVAWVEQELKKLQEAKNETTSEEGG
jgi:DNA repair ATPase RecN